MKRNIMIDEINRGKNDVQGKWFVTRQINYLVLFFQMNLHTEKSTPIYIVCCMLYVHHSIYIYIVYYYNLK